MVPTGENRSPVGMGPWGADPTRWYTPGACGPETRAGVSSRKGAAPLCRPRAQGGRRAQAAPTEALRLDAHPRDLCSERQALHRTITPTR